MKILQREQFDFAPELWEIICALEGSSVGDQMKGTFEDSPYHREESVWVHTEMVIDNFVRTFAPKRTTHHNTLAVCALLFHDSGKPASEETVQKDESQRYRRYPGHEQVSAVTFTEHWLKNPVLRKTLCPQDARAVRWIIEHHLPYGIKVPEKVSALKRATHSTVGSLDLFFDCLRADALGRISDDHQEKLQKVENWISDFANSPEGDYPLFDPSQGTCYILIGASGAGKSTYFREKVQNTVYHSLDMLRLMFFTNDGGSASDPKALYAAAWNYCNENAQQFEKYIARSLNTALREKDRFIYGITIDNVNSSKKARARYVQLARQHRMKVVAVEFWNDLDTLLSRQNTRLDKSVPEDAVRRQHGSLTCAWLGSEVDEVIIQTCENAAQDADE